MNPLWNVWISASIIKAFNDAFEDLWPIFFVGSTEGNEEDILDPEINGRLAVAFSVRKDRQAQNQYCLDAIITVMITSIIAGDSYAHFRNEGQLEANIPSCITIYKMGTDDEAVLAALQWDLRLEPLCSPGTGPNARLSQTVYELHYKYEGILNAD